MRGSFSSAQALGALLCFMHAANTKKHTKQLMGETRCQSSALVITHIRYLLLEVANLQKISPLLAQLNAPAPCTPWIGMYAEDAQQKKRAQKITSEFRTLNLVLK